jgi:hypothetical protein
MCERTIELARDQVFQHFVRHIDELQVRGSSSERGAWKTPRTLSAA